MIYGYIMRTQQKMTIFRFVRSQLRPFYWQMIGLLLVACYWAIHVSLQPYVIKLILDSVSQDPSLNNIAIPVILYIALSVAFALNFRFYDYVWLKLYPPLKAKIINDATDKIVHYSYGFFQNHLAGRLSDKINNLGTGTVKIIQVFVDKFFSHTLALIIACFTLMMVHPLLSLILFGWTAFLVVLSAIFGKEARRLSLDLSEANSNVSGYIVDRFANILNVRLFANRDYEKKILNQNLQKSTQRSQKLRWFLLKLMAIQGLATAVMLSTCLLVLIFSFHSRRITVGDFGLVVTLTLTFADIIWHLAQEISNFSEIHGMVRQGISLLSLKESIKDLPNAVELKISKGDICFENVGFRYPNAEPLFSHKSIFLPAGQKIGLVGFSGSGKSTFVHLILRLFDVTQGRILIDGQDIKTVTQDSLHRSIAMIPQDPTLFHRTLMENIRYGNLTSNDEEVIAAAKKALAHDFISHLTHGYNTLVGERGIKLAGGQRQRIAIARVFLKTAPILILDEATSALDSATESLIKDGLIDLMTNRTTIVIAHRLSTLLHMDRILVFDQGNIVEDGTHETLISKEGLYKTLWEAQVGGFIPDKLI